MTSPLTPAELRLAAEHAEEWSDHGSLACCESWWQPDGFG